MKVQRLAVSALVILGIVGSFTTARSQPAGANANPKTSVRGFVLSALQQQRLRVLYAAYRNIPLTDIAQVALGSVRSARILPAGRQWALIRFEPSAGAPQAVVTRFQDGAGSGIFTRSPGGGWRAAGLGGEPLGCGTLLPSPVRLLWQLSSCRALTWPPGPRAGGASSTAQLAVIAESQIGVSDNPAVQNFNGLDCDPYTAMEVPWVSTEGCGTDPTFNISNESELWCADFVKWVWVQAGVTSDLALLTPSAASFYAWGKAHREHMRTNSAMPHVGDVVVFYPPGRAPNRHYADHVGIVTAVNPDGSINLVNGDFLGAQNIAVQASINITNLGQWAAGIWGPNEQWVFVSPRLPPAGPAPVGHPGN